ncbi:MAG TPA: cupin domain-containing protein [Chloroflexota bacterium]
MPTARVIDNPISGERIVIRATASETDGELLAFEVFLPPGGHVPAGHSHPVQEERFTVLDGQLRFRLGWRTRLATSGDTVVVPPGTVHWFGNPGREIAHARVEVRPALRMEELLASSEGLSTRSRVRRLGDLARLLLEFQPELAVPVIPSVVVRLVLAPVARLGRS